MMLNDIKGTVIQDMEVKVDLLEDRVIDRALHEEIGLFLRYTETGYWTRRGWKWTLTDDDIKLWIRARVQWEHFEEPKRTFQSIKFVTINPN